MRALSRDLTDLLRMHLDEAALDGLEWRDFGKGVRLGKLAREGKAGLLLYRIEAGAPRDAFAPHRHVGGEAYLVLKGVIADSTGRYPAGSFVWLPPGSAHAPWAEGETIVLVLWPEGVEVVDA
ncbi:MAG TPA: cupin domain-containing protein [Planctomycetota bacterium]|nr:cupin domain-containing protein [Planctomycetota bacterium]